MSKNEVLQDRVEKKLLTLQKLERESSNLSMKYQVENKVLNDSDSLKYSKNYKKAQKLLMKIREEEHTLEKLEKKYKYSKEIVSEKMVKEQKLFKYYSGVMKDYTLYYKMSDKYREAYKHK